MRHLISYRSLGWFAAIACAAISTGCHHSTPAGERSPVQAQHHSSMRLTSNAFEDGEALPAEFTCDGAGRSPELQWSEPPSGTQSFALMVEDSDAPNSPFGHWGVYDIPMSARQIDTGAAESGASGLKQTTNDFGQPGYGPPCPPKGDPPHHYHFRLMAMDLPELRRTPANVEAIFNAGNHHLLASAQLVALYGRK
jgi:Raf kinase inhibitor-like YbhB/YbcL family protein